MEWLYNLNTVSTQLSVVRAPLGASTAIFKSKFPPKRAISLKSFMGIPFHPCSPDCEFHISLNGRQECCIQCLGCVHIETAFVDGSCPVSDDMAISALRSRLAFFSKRQRVTPTASYSGPSTSRYIKPYIEATAMCIGGELMEARVVLLGDSPLTSQSSHASCLPVELLNEFESLSQGKFNLSFAARKEDELSLAASENGLEPSEADGKTRIGLWQ